MSRMIDAVDKANKILRQFDLRNPERIARQADIMVLPQPFKKQKGAYTVIERQPIIFIKEDLPSVTRQIVIGHELFYLKAVAINPTRNRMPRNIRRPHLPSSLPRLHAIQRTLRMVRIIIILLPS